MTAYRAAFYAIWAMKVSLATLNMAWATYVALAPLVLALILFSWSLGIVR